jgi:hypothetical protein
MRGRNDFAESTLNLLSQKVTVPLRLFGIPLPIRGRMGLNRDAFEHGIDMALELERSRERERILGELESYARAHPDSPMVARDRATTNAGPGNTQDVLGFIARVRRLR